LSLHWSENNGPAINRPFEPGFGARLVTRLLKNHDGEITPEFRTEGLCVRIAVRLASDAVTIPHRASSLCG
jgi:two-component sensor histidine kinase